MLYLSISISKELAVIVLNAASSSHAWNEQWRASFKKLKEVRHFLAIQVSLNKDQLQLIYFFNEANLVRFDILSKQTASNQHLCYLLVAEIFTTLNVIRKLIIHG